MKRVVLSLVLTLMAQVATSQTAETAAELSWSSTPGNPIILAQEISSLYQTLYNSKNLRIRKIENPTGLDVQTLMRQAGVFRGDGFPWNIDNIVCDLNARLCSRPRNPVSEKELADITRHIGGFAITDSRLSRWRLTAKNVVTIPDYVFSPVTSMERIPVRKGWTPEQAEISEDTDCSPWELECLGVVQDYNPSRGPLKFDGFAILPVVSYVARVPLKSDEVSNAEPDKFRSLIQRLGEDKQLQPNTYALEKEGQFTEQLNSYWGSTSQSGAALERLRENLNAVGTFQQHSKISDEPAYRDQKALFDLIHHPFGKGVDLSEEFQNPVDIVVMDSKLVTEHCDLPSTVFDTPGQENAVCETDFGEFNKKRDHSAHVIGLIAAPMNGKGMIGLNPAARMHFMEVPFDIFGNGEDLIYDKAFRQAHEINARVVNASFGMTPEAGNTRFLRSGIIGLSKNALVVASAGNEARNLTGRECDVYPACYYDEPNVITVVGISNLDAKLALWDDGDGGGSNTNPDFHIAALAADVVSTVDGNKLAWISGTSIAAPQVSAAASLIYSATEATYPDKLNELGVLPPIAVKNRLIYTADILRKFKPQVFAGLLNVERAIQIKYAQLEYIDDAGNAEAVKGHVVQVGTDTIICRLDDGEKSKHAWRDIRRLFKDPGTDRYVLFKLKQPDNPESEIEEQICPRLLSQTNKVWLELDTGETRTLKMEQIRDFTSALFPLPPEFP
ncbi:MAG: S8 family peptidase [Sulfitobacter sp.]